MPDTDPRATVPRMSEHDGREAAARRYSPPPLVDIALIAAVVVLPLVVLATDPKALP